MRYYYKDKLGNYYNYKREHKDLIAITEQEWNERINSLVNVVDERKTTIQNQISELKFNLSSTDYKYFKYVDGEITEEDWLEIQSQRKEWRKQINELEEQL